MALFGRNKEEEYEEDEEFEVKPIKRKVIRPKKEPIKPWGKKERMVVLLLLAITALLSGVLALTARGLKIKKIEKPNINLDWNLFSGKTITIGEDDIK